MLQQPKLFRRKPGVSIYRLFSSDLWCSLAWEEPGLQLPLSCTSFLRLFKHCILASLCSRCFFSVLHPMQFSSCASVLTDSPTQSHFYTFLMVLGHLPYARSSVSSHTVILLCYHIILEMLPSHISNWKALIARRYFPSCNVCGTTLNQFFRISLMRHLIMDFSESYRWN